MTNDYAFVRLNRDDIDLDFTYDHYREILQEIRKTHKVLNFRDCYEMGYERVSEFEKFLILRHDIEISIDGALRLAKIDAEEGMSSTFFFLLSSEYNLFERDDARKIIQIRDLGHDIGLHYDAALIGENSPRPRDVLRHQVDLLESFFDIKVHAMSCHMPMRAGETYQLEGVIDTYDPRYFTQIKYLSDSNQAWREGCVTRSLADHPRIQLLMHENTWSEHGLGFEVIMLNEITEQYITSRRRTEALSRQMHDGLSRRKQKDAEFRKKFG